MLSGVYVIADSVLLSTDLLLLTKVEAALKGGATIIQYRDKSTEEKKRFRQANALFKLCVDYNVPLIINDDIELALAVNADGVHLGQQDATLAEARKWLGFEKIIGATCHDSLALAKDAQKNGASYVAFGACYPSPTKPNAPVITHDVLTASKKELSVPIVAIGGINGENAASVINTGVDMIAVASAVFAGDKVFERTQQLANFFKAKL